MNTFKTKQSIFIVNSLSNSNQCIQAELIASKANFLMLRFLSLLNYNVSGDTLCLTGRTSKFA